MRQDGTPVAFVEVLAIDVNAVDEDEFLEGFAEGVAGGSGLEQKRGASEGVGGD